jgi:hypothetical protein
MVAKIETALDWFQRSQRRRAAAEKPTDPSSAAWAFVRSGTSGIAPVDAAWKTPSTNSNLPIVTIERNVGKPWTLISLAARFVVATRPSRFTTSTSTSSNNMEEEEDATCTTDLPQVVLLDSNYDMTIPKIAHVVRSTLLRQPQMNETSLEKDLDCCLGRIHIATVDDMLGWVPVLECLRCKLKGQETHPTLILWDGYLSESNDESCQMEVTRQVSRLLQDCSIAMVVASRNSTSIVGKIDYQKRDSHRIRLERRSGKDCFAMVNGSRISFSLSLGGILS